MFTATARSLDGTLLHQVDVNGRHQLTTDEPVSVGGSDAGPAPHELLAAMLASCVSTMIVLYAGKRGWELGEVSVEVDYDNEATPRQVLTTIRLPGGLSADQIARLERVAETCPVKRALEAGFSFEHTVTVPSPDGAISGRQGARRARVRIERACHLRFSVGAPTGYSTCGWIDRGGTYLNA